MFEERNQSRRDGHELLRRNVHVIHARRLDVDEVAFAAARDFFREEMAFVVELGVRLRDGELLFAVGGEIINRARDAAFDATGRVVSSLDEMIADAVKGEIRSHH